MVEQFEEVSAPAWAEKAWSGNQNTHITLEMADARMETPYAPGSGSFASAIQISHSENHLGHILRVKKQPLWLTV